MTKIADEIRAATARDELHPLVASNRASPRGLCNCSTRVEQSIVFCTLDYGHEGLHQNTGARWEGRARCEFTAGDLRCNLERDHVGAHYAGDVAPLDFWAEVEAGIAEGDRLLGPEDEDSST